jgi:hypothetical protein
VQATDIISPAVLLFISADDEACRQQAAGKSMPGTVPGAEEAVNAVCYLLQSRYPTAKAIALDAGRQLARAS